MLFFLLDKYVQFGHSVVETETGVMRYGMADKSELLPELFPLYAKAFLC